MELTQQAQQIERQLEELENFHPSYGLLPLQALLGQFYDLAYTSRNRDTYAAIVSLKIIFPFSAEALEGEP